MLIQYLLILLLFSAFIISWEGDGLEKEHADQVENIMMTVDKIYSSTSLLFVSSLTYCIILFQVLLPRKRTCWTIYRSFENLENLEIDGS